MENHTAAEVIGNPQAPYLTSLAQQGLSLTKSFGVTHPSQPNYLAFFSGSTHRLTSDTCPHTFSGPNLATELVNAGYTFIGYSESLPRAGYSGCTAGAYARKHNPWVDFSGLPPSVNQPFTAFPTDYARLATVSIVVPNLNHDMHDGTITEGDSWLRHYLGGYANWVTHHNSLLIVTWDEDDGSARNLIPTIIIGGDLLTGTDSTISNQYTLLRTIEDAYHLPHLGGSASAPPLIDDWQR
jgi:hypothetical protein